MGTSMLKYRTFDTCGARDFAELTLSLARLSEQRWGNRPLLIILGSVFLWPTLCSKSGLARKTPGRPPSGLQLWSEISIVTPSHQYIQHATVASLNGTRTAYNF